jgi:hypothetical protein
MKKTLHIFSTTLALLFSTLVFAQPAGWSFAKSIRVANTSSVAAINYQLKLTINTQALITATQMLASGADIRFGKNCAGTIFYNYWIESGSINTTTTNIWVKIDTIPANGSRTFYMFHGNTTASPTSSVAAVFIGPHSATDSVASGAAGGATNSQRAFRFTPTEDLLVTHFGKREPNGTPREVTLFNFTTQALLTQFTVTGAAAQYNYGALPNPIWLTNATQYVLSLYQGPTDGYYFGSSSQIGQHMTYGDMRYCNSCASTTFPTSILTNFHYGYPDLWYWTKNNFTPAPTYTYNLPTTISSIVPSSTAVCGASTVGLVANNATGGLTYSWQPNGASGASVVVTPTATTVYSLITTDPSCSLPYNTATVSIGVNAAPSISVNSGAVCAGQSFTITPSGASTYTYQGGSSVITPTANVTLSVTGTGTNGCVSAPVNSSITVNSLPNISVNSGSICQGQSFTISATGASTYTYQGGSSVVTPTANVTLSVTGTGTNGCTSAPVNSSITVTPLPNVTAVNAPSLICTGSSATLTANGATTYSWNSGGSTSAIVVSPTVTTTYTVTGTSNGCSKTATITQNVSACTGLVTNTANGNNTEVYPNPNNGTFALKLSTDANVMVIDLVGKIILNETLKAGQHTISLGNVAKGVYFLKTESNGKQETIKLVKE